MQAALAAHPASWSAAVRLDLANARRAYWLNQSLPSLDVSAGVALRGYDAVLGAAWGQVAQRRAARGPRGALLRRAARPRRGPRRVRTRADRRRAGRVRAARASRPPCASRSRTRGPTSTPPSRAYALATRQVELAELKLKAQVDKYKSGLSTLADVVRFQRDLDARSSAAQRVAQRPRRPGPAARGHRHAAARSGGRRRERRGPLPVPQLAAEARAEPTSSSRASPRSTGATSAEVPVLHGVDLRHRPR